MKSKDNSQQNHNYNNSSFLIELLETFLTSFIVLMAIYWWVALPEVVSGASMEPTIYAEERILVERVTKPFKNYSRGDIVVLHPPGNDNIDYVKRIVGVPGDIFKIYDCNVYISSSDVKAQLNEPYLSEGTCTKGDRGIEDGKSIRLSENEYVVLGDNRDNSEDSRFFGVVNRDRIVGKVVLRFWPPKKVTIF